MTDEINPMDVLTLSKKITEFIDTKCATTFIKARAAKLPECKVVNDIDTFLHLPIEPRNEILNNLKDVNELKAMQYIFGLTPFKSDDQYVIDLYGKRIYQ